MFVSETIEREIANCEELFEKSTLDYALQNSKVTKTIHSSSFYIDSKERKQSTGNTHKRFKLKSRHLHDVLRIEGNIIVLCQIVRNSGRDSDIDGVWEGIEKRLTIIRYLLLT